jgi:hypothetical protein
MRRLRLAILPASSRRERGENMERAGQAPEKPRTKNRVSGLMLRQARHEDSFSQEILALSLSKGEGRGRAIA